jgi:glycine/D-amino acid oxidase-like deaminating enzyme
MQSIKTDTVVIGAGSVGIAVAYYLKKMDPSRGVILLDQGQPMAFTSAQSGENYRNWWPHPVMRAFSDHSIDLMEDIARETDNRIQMTRRGYVLVTRVSDISEYEAGLVEGYAGSSHKVREHRGGSTSYQAPTIEDWVSAPTGVDILRGPGEIAHHFPCYADDLQNIIHIRRAGMISSQQLGAYMLEQFKALGGKFLLSSVEGLSKDKGFKVELLGGQVLQAAQLVNAAGPFVGKVAGMLGVDLPVTNWLQQKIAFEDREGAIERTMPFTIDLDEQQLDWSAEERELLSEDQSLAWLAAKLPGGVHCRPEGGDGGRWLKLGWAYNQSEASPTFEPQFDDSFPEIVLRGAARLHPKLKAYYGKLPRAMSLYGGYYTLTDENWPLLGPTTVDGFHVAGALSGFGTMAACASGELVAQHILGAALPSYAAMFSPQRYDDPDIVQMLKQQSNRGIL